MKYLPEHYAEALYGALNQKKGKVYNNILRNFVVLLQKNGDYKYLNTILNHYEKIYLAKNKLKKIELETPVQASEALKSRIKKAVKSEVSFIEKVNPNLIGGLTLLINDSLYIDASIKSKVDKLFSHS